jgi:hypothetical protein
MKPFLQTLFALLALCAPVAHAQAKYSGEDRGRPVQPAQVNLKWQQECAGCHMAFQPALLPAASWRKMMTGLDKHFGADASLTPAETIEITAYLVRHASNRWTSATAPLRITEAMWFKSKHREVSPSAWQHASVKSPANCMACHPGSDKGDFEESSVRVPR